jgi:ribonuclease G
LKAASFSQATAEKIGSVYIGKVKNISENINACFVEIADKEICFLSLLDAVNPLVLNRKYDGRILCGDELLVQVVREAQKTKPATVTSRIVFSNDYFVFELGAEKVNFSNKLEKSEKKHLISMMKELHIMDDKGFDQERLAQLKLVHGEQHPFTEALTAGVIARTKAKECKTAEEVSACFETLYTRMKQLLESALYRNCFTCMSSGPKYFEKALSELVQADEFDEIVTDDAALYEDLLEYVKLSNIEKPIRLYQDPVMSLSKLYSLTTKLEAALNERVWLKSGAYLLIQHTEALTVIDVNSGKYAKGRSEEESALAINIEAAREIAWQLRLRNLSGIIIVDFINMEEGISDKQLLQTLKEAVKEDKVQTVVVDMTALGLVEMTRKKANKPLHEQISYREVKN